MTTDASDKKLSTKELKQLILLCGRTGVSSLKLGSLEIVYHGLNNQVPHIINRKSKGKVETVPLDQDALKSFEEAQIMIDDPLEFEERKIQELLSGPRS